jgi:hypothetical protein
MSALLRRIMNRSIEMSEQEQTEFMNSLALARRALYARDPKRRAIEAIERQVRDDDPTLMRGIEDAER